MKNNFNKINEDEELLNDLIKTIILGYDLEKLREKMQKVKEATKI